MTIGVIHLFINDEKDLNKLNEFYNSLDEEKLTFKAPLNLIQKAKFMFVNEYEGNFIAICGVLNNDESFLCVKKEFQGRGIGKRLHQLAIKRSKEMRINKIRASAFNPVAKQLCVKSMYKKLYHINEVVYYELSLSNITRLTYPIRRIIFFLFGFWMNLKRAARKRSFKLF